MIFAIIVFLSAISISAIAAGYSIIGLAALFSGATVAIIAMGSALEVGKLVAASWLYQNWKNPNLPTTIKAYLTTAVIVLVFVTSMGIFGFLSKAHLDQMRPEGNNAVQIQLIDKQILSQEVIIQRAEKTLNLLDKGLEVYIDKEYVSRGLKERKKQKEERDLLNNEIKIAMNEIARLSVEKSGIEIEQLKIEAEGGECSAQRCTWSVLQGELLCLEETLSAPFFVQKLSTKLAKIIGGLLGPGGEGRRPGRNHTVSGTVQNYSPY